MTLPDYTLLRERLAEVARTTILDEVPQIENYKWPERSMRALADAGLMGLAVPERFGGMDAGLTGLVIAGEEIGRICPSASLCYCMHVVGSAVIAAKPNDYQIERYILPIMQGRHITTLALSEPGTGIHFYESAGSMERHNGSYIVNAHKAFVTNGRYADSYVISTRGEGPAEAPGMFNCLIVDRDTPGARFEGEWRGLGMRGNSSVEMLLTNVTVPDTHLLGDEGDQNWYVFHVVAPYFLTAMAATYIGIAQSAFDFVLDYVKDRSYAHNGKTLAAVPAIQTHISSMWSTLQQAKLLVYHAAERADLGDAGALPYLLASKVAAVEAAVAVTNEAMTCAGGKAYRENSMLWSRLRDARAGDVMAPTTDILRTWTARALLDLPLL